MLRTSKETGMIPSPRQLYRLLSKLGRANGLGLSHLPVLSPDNKSGCLLSVSVML